MSGQRTTLTIETAVDLERGDVLTDDGRDLVVTGLIPATREAALAYGAREVRSGSWSRTYDATEAVTAAPGPARLTVRCQVGRCTNPSTGTISACGTVHACDDCRALVGQLTAQRIAQDATIHREYEMATAAEIRTMLRSGHEVRLWDHDGDHSTILRVESAGNAHLGPDSANAIVWFTGPLTGRECRLRVNDHAPLKVVAAARQSLGCDR